MSEGSSRKAMTMVLAGNGLVVAHPKFKQCKVSVTRDCPLGCGRVAALSSRSSELITVDRSSQGKWFRCLGILSTLRDQVCNRMLCLIID
ncbi:hypothetical protein J1N35_007594 [Gossypium stocksii]|uniref:Uncharacterized protein n=1 Tax=Gossypium stocksii TaxID=47602 RepID=A0A9D3W6X1_9ROSI|nr:hypothetical protein J1N35_007594 [Gossypium stocksii]